MSHLTDNIIARLMRCARMHILSRQEGPTTHISQSFLKRVIAASLGCLRFSCLKFKSRSFVVATKREKGRRRKDAIPQNRFPALLQKYVSIKTIDIKLTLKNGSEIILNRDREFIDDTVMVYREGQLFMSIPMNDILKADLFAA